MAESNTSTSTVRPFYHVRFTAGSIGEGLIENLTKEQALFGFICPFIVKEVYPLGGFLFGASAFRTLEVFSTPRPMDENWPFPVERTTKAREKWKLEDTSNELTKYEPPPNTAEFFRQEGYNCTDEVFSEAVHLIESGTYQTARRSISEQFSSNEAFMIMPIGNQETDDMYHLLIKPTVQRHGFDIHRSDEIPHTGLVLQAITKKISQARFVVADLTDAKPNCYYEVGYAHALGKPCMFLAKEGTVRHFDVSGYKWNYWADIATFQPLFEKELEGVLATLRVFPRSQHGV